MTFNEMFVLVGIKDKKTKEKIQMFFSSTEKFIWSYENIEEMLSSSQIKKINVLRSITQKSIYSTLKDSYDVQRLCSVQDVVSTTIEKYPKILYQNTEMFVIIMVNVKNEIIKTMKVESFAHDRCVIDIPSIARMLIMNDEVRAFFTIHNHPSGDCKRSKEDEETFKKFKDVGDILKIQNLDNIIVGKVKDQSIKIYSSYAKEEVMVQL